MHPYLIRLGVRPEVQSFFSPFYTAASGDLIFQQGVYLEHFGMGFHRLSQGRDCWLAGEKNLALVSRVFVGESAMDAIAFLHFQGHTLANWERSLFVATGAGLPGARLRWIREQLKGKKLTMLFPGDLPGRIADLKVAAAFRGMPAAASLAEKERLTVSFRAKEYQFDRETFSLAAFERAANYRFKVVTQKPKHGASFYEQLKAGAFPSI